MDKVTFAKTLRKNQTEAERRMWYFLRSRRFKEIKFRRQQPIGPYIIDFISFEQKIIIELDGSQHFKPKNLAYDLIRDKFFTDQGYKVLRFTNYELFENREEVFNAILRVSEDSSKFHPHPLLLPSREKEL